MACMPWSCCLFEGSRPLSGSAVLKCAEFVLIATLGSFENTLQSLPRSGRGEMFLCNLIHAELPIYSLGWIT